MARRRPRPKAMMRTRSRRRRRLRINRKPTVARKLLPKRATPRLKHLRKRRRNLLKGRVNRQDSPRPRVRSGAHLQTKKKRTRHQPRRPRRRRNNSRSCKASVADVLISLSYVAVSGGWWRVGWLMVLRRFGSRL